MGYIIYSSIMDFSLKLQKNLIAFLLVFIAFFLVEGMQGVDFSHGNFLFLPLGAEILAYLLFGFRVLPGIVIANTLIGYFLWENWFGNGFYGFIGHVVVGSLAPIAAILTMKAFSLSEFFKGKELDFRHVLFLVILTGLFNSFAKFFVFMGIMGQDINVVTFLSTYLVGDILGGIVFIYVATKMAPLLIKQ